MKKLPFFPLAIFILTFSSCKLEPNWDVDALAPIAETTLTPGNMFPVGETSAIDSSGKLKYVYEDEVYTVPLDSLFTIPDTAYVYNFTAPFAVTIQPGFPAPVFDGYISPNIKTATLTELIVLSGGIDVIAESFAARKLKLEFSIPKAIKNGQPFYYQTSLDAAGNSSISLNQSINLDGYKLDLTGDDGLIGNRFRMKITATIDSGEDPLPVASGFEIVKCTIKLNKIKPYFAKGKVNTQSLKISSDTLKLGVMEMIKSGAVDLEDISLLLQIENGMGVDLQALIYEIAGKNGYNGSTQNLTGSSINNAVNVNRAQNNPYQTPEYTPSVKEILFNSGNSNLTSFIENLPAQIAINAKFIVNPFGNVSGGNDFIYYNSKTSLKIRVEAPLAFSINELVLMDTVNLNLNPAEETEQQNQPVKSATVRAYVENGFPLEADLQVYFLGQDGISSDSLFFQQRINSALVGPDLKVSSSINSVLEAKAEGLQLDRLLSADKIWFKVRLNSYPQGQLIYIYDNYKMKVKLVAQLTYQL